MADYKLRWTHDRETTLREALPDLTSLPKEGFGVQYIADSYSLFPPEEVLEMSCEFLVLGKHQGFPSS